MDEARIAQVVNRFDEFKKRYSASDKQQPEEFENVLKELFFASLSGSAECSYYLNHIRQFCYIDGINADIYNYYRRIEAKIKR